MFPGTKGDLQTQFQKKVISTSEGCEENRRRRHLTACKSSKERRHQLAGTHTSRKSC